MSQRSMNKYAALYVLAAVIMFVVVLVFAFLLAGGMGRATSSSPAERNQPPAEVPPDKTDRETGVLSKKGGQMTNTSEYLPRGAASEEIQSGLPPGTVKETFLQKARFPVSFVFTPDGRMFYNELRTGKIRIVENSALLPEPLYDFDISIQPETGLIGLALDPDFSKNHYLYVYYTASEKPGMDGPGLGLNQLVRLTEVEGKGTDLTPIFPNVPSGNIHNGGNIHFGSDGKLYLSTGNINNDGLSQDIKSVAGKILRMNSDGSVPEDNPMLSVEGANPYLYAYGFRNSFNFAFHPVTGQIWATENGPGDFDELNLVLPGRNYGWPPSGFQQRPGLEDPARAFGPVIAPTGIDFYRGDKIDNWENDLFMAAFNTGVLRRFILNQPDYNLISVETTVTSGAYLDIETGPDGCLYFSSMDSIYRIRLETAEGLPLVKVGDQEGP